MSRTYCDLLLIRLCAMELFVIIYSLLGIAVRARSFLVNVKELTEAHKGTSDMHVHITMLIIDNNIAQSCTCGLYTFLQTF